MSVTQEQLMAYADGELDGVEKALVEAELTSNAEARATVDRHRALRAKLSGAFAPALEEPVPQRLVEAARAAAKAPAPNVVDFAAARERKLGWTRREWGAMAACLMVGVLFGGVALRKPDPMIMASNGGLVANGALERALDTQLASDAGKTVRIGLTFRGQGGESCRTYSYENGGVSGMACREDDTWRVQMAVASAPRAPSQFRTASVETPPALLALVEEKIAGETLDAAQEKAARDGGWR